MNRSSNSYLPLIYMNSNGHLKPPPPLKLNYVCVLFSVNEGGSVRSGQLYTSSTWVAGVDKFHTHICLALQFSPATVNKNSEA